MDLKGQAQVSFEKFITDLRGWDEATPDVQAICRLFYHAGFAGGQLGLAQELQVKLGEGKVKEGRGGDDVQGVVWEVERAVDGIR